LDIFSVGSLSTPLKGGAKRLESGAKRLGIGAKRLVTGAKPLNNPRNIMEAIRYIVDTLLWLADAGLRVASLVQWVRADFRDPMADAIVRITKLADIAAAPSLLPPSAKFDTQRSRGHRRGGRSPLAALGLPAGVGDAVQFLRITIVTWPGWCCASICSPFCCTG